MDFFNGCVSLFNHTFQAAAELEFFQLVNGFLVAKLILGFWLLLRCHRLRRM